jgi:CRISPR-associated endonuclease/helicase Cas3
MGKKLAHIDGEREQSVYSHLVNVAEKTAEFCEDYKIAGANVPAYAYEVGLAHDIGKYSEVFQRKIHGDASVHVDHSTAGARELTKRKMAAGSFAVAGHHGGIPNGWDTSEQNLMQRVKKREIEPYGDYADEIKLEEVAEPRVSPFEFGFFARMLFSSLADADFLDTESFMSEGRIVRGDYDSIQKLHTKLMEYIATWRKVDENTPELNKIRTGILEQCLCMGNGERGLYSLTVPTGGGKTVSSLAFALEHAKKNGMKRIIYVIPYTNIIEQTVGVFQDILGEQNVLAHYANSLLCSDNEQKDYYEKHKLSIENWDAPVIVTTNVQFFESLYSNKVSKCRKLHNIANSVIIFDEVQMIPLNYLKPCAKAIQLLVESYSASAVLCSATQPALEAWMRPLEIKEICPNHAELFQKLKRTIISDMGNISEDELSEKMCGENQVLSIVNLRSTAQEIYQNLPEDGSFHLSTYMRPVDRKDTLRTIRKRLQEGEVCRVVSTSLVEAGVDLDFPSVLREMAGLDSIVQAAGRCNREGKRNIDESMVGVFRFSKTPRMIEKNVSMTEETFQKYGEYDSLEAIHYYFSSLQHLDEDSLDQHHILESFEKPYQETKMPFKKIAENFHLIDSDTRMLIIPIEKKATDLVGELEQKIKNEDSIKQVLQRLGEFSVNVYENKYNAMIEDNSAYEVIDGIAVLQNLSLYTKEIGLSYKGENSSVLIF